MLAICLVSQFFKNLSVYITGPIINAALILTVLYAGMACGIILSIITPVTSFFITGSPVMAAYPCDVSMYHDRKYHSSGMWDCFAKNAVKLQLVFLYQLQ